MPKRQTRSPPSRVHWISPTPGTQLVPGSIADVIWSSFEPWSADPEISICDSATCSLVQRPAHRDPSGLYRITAVIPPSSTGDIHFEMSLSADHRAQSPSFPIAPSPNSNANSNPPDARAHPPPPPPDAPPPTGSGGGYPVVPPLLASVAGANPGVGIAAGPASLLTPPTAVISPTLAATAISPVATVASPPSTIDLTAVSAVPVDPSLWAVPPAASWVADGTPAPSPVAPAEVVATWKADAQHTSPPDAVQTVQVSWFPSTLPIDPSANLTFTSSVPTLPNGTLTNSTLANGTASLINVSAPSGLAIAGIAIPLILSSLLLLTALSYCARKRSRAGTRDPRVSDLEEGKPGSFSSGSTYRDSLASSLLAARNAVEDGHPAAYPGYDSNGVSITPRGGLAEMREVPSVNITHASPIAPPHDARDDGPIYQPDTQGDGTLYDEPGSLAVPTLRMGDANYAPNVLYSDAAGNILAPLGSLTPVRILNDHAGPSSSGSGSRCLTPRSATELEDTVSELSASYNPYTYAQSHAASSGRPSARPVAGAFAFATRPTSSRGCRESRDEPWKCQDCGSAKLLRSTSVDRSSQSSFFGSTYWTPKPSRQATMSTEYGGESVCSCPPRSEGCSSSSRDRMRSNGQPMREMEYDYPSAPISSASSAESSGSSRSIGSSSSERCTCSTACSTATAPRPPPPSVTRQPRTHRRKSTYDASSLPPSRSGSLPWSVPGSPPIPAALRLGRPSSASSSTSSTACSHSAAASADGRAKEKAAASWLHHLNGSAGGSKYSGSIATEGHGHGCPSHSHSRAPRGQPQAAARSYTAETARSAVLPSPWAPLRPRSHKKEEWRWERVPTVVYDALERTETGSSVDTSVRMFRR